MSPACSGISNRLQKLAGMREVLEAVEEGIEMGGGPATVSARFALEVMAGVFPDEM